MAKQLHPRLRINWVHDNIIPTFSEDFLKKVFSYKHLRNFAGLTVKRDKGINFSVTVMKHNIKQLYKHCILITKYFLAMLFSRVKI